MKFNEMPVDFRFEVNFASSPEVVGMFQEISGLEPEANVEPIAEGGENRFAHALPGLAKHGNLVLKRGLSETNARLVTWCRDVLEGGLGKPVELHDLEISLLNQNGAVVAKWGVQRAYPVAWRPGGFDAMKNELVIDSIELAYKELIRKT